uniref:Glutathione S-transferase theta 1a n=1 Tax=Maylandia zebra TaxID=106582 RepID=A0A3P9CX22_9CICH
MKPLQPSLSDMIELYLDLISPPCRAVFLFAKALGIPFEFKYVDLNAGQQYSSEFGKLNIVVKIPVMKDGGFTLSERYSRASLVSCRPAAAHANENLSWQHANLRGHCQKVFLLRTLFPVIMGLEVPEVTMDAALENMKQSLNLLEEKFLQNKQFILGDKISVADVVAVVEIMQPLGTGVDGFEGLKEELGEELMDDAHKALMQLSGLPEKLKSSSEFQKFKLRLQRFFN